MKAQAYYDDPKNMIVRIFSTGPYSIADLPLNAATPESADHALRQMRLRRCSQWARTDWGQEARVCFRSSNDRLERPHASGGTLGGVVGREGEQG
jgi:hypothetical protein